MRAVGAALRRDYARAILKLSPRHIGAPVLDCDLAKSFDRKRSRTNSSSSTARIEAVHLLLLAYRSQWAMTTRQHGIRVQ